MSTDHYSLSDILGPHQTNQESLLLLQKNPKTYHTFKTFTEKHQKTLLAFFSGERSLDIQMDPFFKKIMDPETHLDRLEMLLSAILEEEIKITEILPNEGIRLTEKSSFVVMDVVAVLKNGSYINVEMQKIGYQFPAQRTECYLSDMTMRQYNRLRSKRKDKFSYRDMKKTYLFIIMAESPSAFQKSHEYIHTRQTSYSSGIKLPETAHITYITLDTFQESVQNIDSLKEAWLTFLSFDDAERVVRLVNKYPQFLPMYQEIAEFRKSPEEVVGMFSEALYIMDKNAERLMVDDLQEKYAAEREKNKILRKEKKIASAKLKKTTVELENTTAELENKTAELNESKAALKDKDRQIAELKERLTAKA